VIGKILQKCPNIIVVIVAIFLYTSTAFLK
jgi:hypothetical protein